MAGLVRTVMVVDQTGKAVSTVSLLGSGSSPHDAHSLIIVHRASS